MSDRIHSLLVVLDKDYRDDDVECIVDAIKMIKGVADVHMNVSDAMMTTAITRVRQELGQKLLKVIYPNL
jgi:hypothetical protein